MEAVIHQNNHLLADIHLFPSDLKSSYDPLYWHLTKKTKEGIEIDLQFYADDLDQLIKAIRKKQGVK